MSNVNLATTIILWFVLELIADLITKSPFWIVKQVFIAYISFTRELIFLRKILSNKKFLPWSSKRGGYVALKAIKASQDISTSTIPVLDGLEQFIKKKEPVVLVGEPGSGKTTAIRALTYKLAINAYYLDLVVFSCFELAAILLLLISPGFSLFWLLLFPIWKVIVERAVIVPIYLEGRDPSIQSQVSDWLERRIDDLIGRKPLFGSFPCCILLIDGVNEVTGRAYSNFVESWRVFLEDHRKIRVIFSSRTGEDPSTTLQLNNMLIVKELDDSGIHTFLKVYGNDLKKPGDKPYSDGQARLDFNELRRKNLISRGGIGRNPYWLKMIINSGLYTRNKGKLFLKFIETLLLREIGGGETPEERKHKPAWDIVPIPVELNLLAQLAKAMHLEKSIGFGKEQGGWEKGKSIIADNLGESKYKAEDVLGEAGAATIIRGGDGSNIEFAHQLVQEFFVAYAHRNKPDYFSITKNSGDTWWWQTLLILGGLVDAYESHQVYELYVRQIADTGKNDLPLFLSIGLLNAVETEPSEDLSSYITSRFSDSVNLPLNSTQVTAVQDLSYLLGEDAFLIFNSFYLNTNIEIKTKGAALLCATKDERAYKLLVTERNDSVSNILGIVGQLAIDPLSFFARSHEEVGLRILAARALGDIHHTDSIKTLIRLLYDEEHDVCAESSKSLAKIGEPAVQSLITILNHDRVFSLARDTLIRIGVPSVEPLLMAFRTKLINIEKTIFILEKIGPRAIELLLKNLPNIDEKYYDEIDGFILGMGKKAIKPLGNVLDTRDCKTSVHAMRIMGYIKDKDVVEKLIEFLREIALNAKDRSLFDELRSALIRIGMVAISPLQSAMNTDNGDTQFTNMVKEILRGINPPNYDANASFTPYSNPMEDDIQDVMEASIPTSMGMPSAMEILQRPLRGIHLRLNNTRRKSRDEMILPGPYKESSKKDNYDTKIAFHTDDPQIKEIMVNLSLEALHSLEIGEIISAIDILADCGDKRALPALEQIIRSYSGIDETVWRRAKYAYNRISRG
jgi:HEAT repeat protein